MLFLPLLACRTTGNWDRCVALATNPVDDPAVSEAGCERVISSSDGREVRRIFGTTSQGTADERLIYKAQSTATSFRSFSWPDGGGGIPSTRITDTFEVDGGWQATEQLEWFANGTPYMRYRRTALPDDKIEVINEAWRDGGWEIVEQFVNPRQHPPHIPLIEVR